MTHFWTLCAGLQRASGLRGQAGPRRGRGRAGARVRGARRARAARAEPARSRGERGEPRALRGTAQVGTEQSLRCF